MKHYAVSIKCLAMQRFKSRIYAKILLEHSRREYKAPTPYLSLARLTPAECKRQLTITYPDIA
jgi:hypothetical protein